MEPTGNQRIAQFLYELGTMRKLPRMHRQTLLTDDMSDNIATHTFRVVMIGYFLAVTEGIDAAKVMLMCQLHDMGEARTGDHNWIHKRYVIEKEEALIEEQLGTLPDGGYLLQIAREYHRRESREAIVAKDADLLDQVLLLREYAWQGNKEAQVWLDGKREKQPYNYLKHLKTETAIRLGRAIYDEEPSSWWTKLYQKEREHLPPVPITPSPVV